METLISFDIGGLRCHQLEARTLKVMGEFLIVPQTFVTTQGCRQNIYIHVLLQFST